MPDYRNEPWFKERQAWAKAHPGYCPACGLPKDYCYDRDPAFREAKSRVDDPRTGYGPIIRRWHSGALRKMPIDVLEKLPVPIAKLRAELTLAEMKHRGLVGHKPLVRRSAWQILMGEPVV
jgi:hypothetical protein